ncbi:MAG TPA: YMGG-like glycine zipper-containing protein, partial [Gemmatimonadaceae bacterium]|nr:YMGG-like glycine zipper-containing protein [Gemmatimonadaceae bacterium]
PAPVSQPVRTRVVYRDRPVYRSSGSSGTYSTARTTTRIKHTKRDAAIGAAAGAAIGAVTSRDKLKGAVVGGVAGAVLGGVLGNNVDITKR